MRAAAVVLAMVAVASSFSSAPDSVKPPANEPADMHTAEEDDHASDHVEEHDHASDHEGEEHAVDEGEIVVAWTAGFSDPSARMLEGLEGGEALKFEWTMGYHNVYQMASKEAYDACDFTDAIFLGDMSPVSFTFPVDSSAIYFSCSISGHCSGGQKLAVSAA